jgi:ABC-type bacteriocin/lantibiotic exporter with double-glycine peptidase domain
MQQFLHTQQRAATCAVAAIRTVLHRQFGVRVPEAALVALATSPDDPIVSTGSSTKQMRQMVRQASRAFNPNAPWTLRVHRRGTMRMLQSAVRRGRWPLVQVYLPDQQEHHIVVVLEVTPTHVKFFDPDPGHARTVRRKSHQQFLDWWTSPVDGIWWAVINGGELRLEA